MLPNFDLVYCPLVYLKNLFSLYLKITVIFIILFRPMEPNEAKNILKLMGSRNIQVLEKILVTVSNLATFTPNQV